MLVIAVGVLSFGSIGTAASTSLVINEVDYDQAGTDASEFFELKNVSGATINLDAYRVELINGSTSALYLTVDLPNVDLAAGDYFVVCANTTTTANCGQDVTPDTNLIQNGDPDGLRLMLGTTAIDALSYGGDTAGATEGSGAGLDDTAAGDESLSRCPDGADSDVNNADFSLKAFSPGAANVCGTPPPPEPTGPTLVVNEIDYDQPSTDTAEFVELKNVNSQPVNLGTYTVELVNGTGGGAVVYQTIALPAVSLAAGDYFVVCANNTNTTDCDLDVDPNENLVQNGDPDAVAVRKGGALIDTVSYDGNTGAPYTEGSGEGLGDSSSTAGVGISRCADGVDTNVNNVDLSQQAITPGATNACPPPPPPPNSFGACGDDTETPIHAIQGSGTATPVAGEIRVVEGVVVGDYQQVGGFNGYYLQEEGADADGDALTSEGIFVFSGSLAGGALDVAAGDIVRVRGTASEFSGLTQIGTLTDVAVCPGEAEITPTALALPVASIPDHERTEGMLVNFSQTLTATEVFNLGRFGEISLSGVGRLRNPTAVALPGAPAQAVLAENNRSRIILDDGDNRQNIDPTVYPTGGLSATNTLRVGDTLNGLTGVMDFRFSNYRIQPVGAVDFIGTNLRTPAPAAVGGSLKVASFNVLNYFNGDGMGGGFPTSRGAETVAEFDRQEAKIVSALAAIDADVVGLMEIENDGGATSAIAELVAALNDATAAGTYAYVDTGVIGTDAIKVALIYKPAAVTPVGVWDVITTADDPRFVDTLNRPSLAQTFRHNASAQKLTVLVNHLKSKGSACAGDPDTGDGSGNCNQTRTNAAEAIVDWLGTDPTGSGDPDFLIIGDLNSYTFETPIQALEAGGFENLIRTFNGLEAYSYVFQGESGYLDHALGTASLAGQVTGVTEWHINPDEPTVLDYNTNFKSLNHQTTLYDPGPYRSSDHDPVIVGLQLDLTYDSLCELTREYVDRDGVADAMCARLDAAERAEADGNEFQKERALRAYVRLVEQAERAGFLTADEAATLIALAGTL
ncbi:MAG: ExeM/NucH family extracellular endonuclease [Gaiellaceae bacterium]